jgi:hypothetical protein
MNRKTFIAGIAALAAATGIANAAVTEIALVIDASGSISGANYNLQKNAYAAAVSDSTIVPVDGTVAIGVWQFATSVQQVFPVTVIDDAGDVAALAGALSGMSRAGLGNLTALGEAIEAAHLGLIAAVTPGETRSVIDVSTDGMETVNAPPQASGAAAAAIAAGIYAVNGLGIGPLADLSWVPGPPSFSVPGVTFATLEEELGKKIVRERLPDGGMTAVMLGAGLIGLAALRRRIA